MFQCKENKAQAEERSAMVAEWQDELKCTHSYVTQELRGSNLFQLITDVTPNRIETKFKPCDEER